MKKAPLIALGILVILGGIYLTIATKPDVTIQTPMTIDAVDDLARVEIVLPEGGETAMVVFENRDGAWWLTRPIQAPVSQETEQKLNALFSAPIKTDDLELSEDKTRAYLLDEPSAARISAYAEGATRPAVDLMVGKEIEIPQTRVARTYVKKPDAPRIYRAQVAMGEFVRSPVSKLRSRRMVRLDASNISALTVERAPKPDNADGIESPGPLKLRHDGELWTLVEPAQETLAPGGAELDQRRVESLARSVATLRAAGFADDQKPADVGLEPARTTLQIEEGGQTHILRLGESTEDKKVYARFDDGPIFTISQATGDRLHPEAKSLLSTAHKDAAAANSPAP